MHKFLKKVIAAALCISMLSMAACKQSEVPSSSAGMAGNTGDSSSQAETAMGRYIEEELSLPSEIKQIQSKIHRLTDGTLQMLTNSSDGKIIGPWSIYATSDEGKTWTKKDTPWLAQFDEATIVAHAYDTKDNMYIAAITYTDEIEQMLMEALKAGEMPPADLYPPYLLYKVNPAGDIEPINVELKKDDEGRINVMDLTVSEDGDIIISNGENCTQFDAATGEIKNDFIVPYSSEMFVNENILYTVSGNQDEIQRFDLRNGETLDPIPVEGGNLYSSALQLSNDKKSIYRCDGQGVYRFILGGSIWEQVIDGELTSLNMPSVNIAGVNELDNGDYLILTTSGDFYAPLRFVYSEDVPTVPIEELNVFSLHDNPTIRQAMGLFQRKHPEISVKIQVAVDGQSAITESDAIRSLNTELLAGKGPDLLLLDGLPLDSYIQKGVLSDLSSLLNPLIEKGELIKNIVQTYSKGEAVYAIPARFGVPHIWGSNEMVDKANNLTALADWIAAENQKNPAVRAFLRMAPSELIEDFYYTCSPAWRNQDGSIKEAEFSQFLQDIKKIADTGDGTPAQQDFETRTQAMIWGSTGEEGSFENMIYLSQTFDDLAFPDAIASIIGGRKFAFTPGQSQDVYVPEVIIGMNANSTLQEQAKEFISILLSNQVQGNDFSDGYPVNVQALVASAAYPYFEGDDGMQAPITVDGQEKWIQILWPTEEFMNQVIERTKNLSTPSTQDPILLEMIVDETIDYFAGNKPLEETVSAVIQRTQAYLAE